MTSDLMHDALHEIAAYSGRSFQRIEDDRILAVCQHRLLIWHDIFINDLAPVTGVEGNLLSQLSVGEKVLAVFLHSLYCS